MTTKFPVDAPKQKVIKAFEALGFRVVREKEHIAMVRDNPDTVTVVPYANADFLKDLERPMPGLFAMDEMTGGFFYLNYPAGVRLMRDAVFGRIAGTNAARFARETRP